jgi:hypothetical protein
MYDLADMTDALKCHNRNVDFCYFRDPKSIRQARVQQVDRYPITAAVPPACIVKLSSSHVTSFQRPCFCYKLQAIGQFSKRNHDLNDY